MSFIMSIIFFLGFVFSLTSGVRTLKLFPLNVQPGGCLILIEMENFYNKHYT